MRKEDKHRTVKRRSHRKRKDGDGRRGQAESETDRRLCALARVCSYAGGPVPCAACVLFVPSVWYAGTTTGGHATDHGHAVGSGGL